MNHTIKKKKTKQVHKLSHTQQRETKPNHSVCKFIKHFEEPKEKYVCFSTVLFYKESYIKTTKNLEVIDVSEEKVRTFAQKLIKTLIKFSDGTYPPNFYLRLYYDSSVFKVKIYKKLFELMKNHKKIQLVEYRCEDFVTNKNVHMDLFGTLTRFYSIFDPDSKNMEYCIIIDVDNDYGEAFLKVFDEFKKSEKLIYGVQKITQIPFHSNDFIYGQNDSKNSKNNLFEFIYFIAFMIMVKRDPVFDIKYWNLYFDNMYNQNDLVYIYNYLDFKRFYFGSKLKFEDVPQSYSAFFYGTDEIWVNYVLKKILKDANQEDKLGCYFTKDFDLVLVMFKLKEFIEYAYERNRDQFNIFIKHCDFLGNMSERNYKNIMSLLEDLSDKKKKDNFKKILNFMNQLKRNKFLNRIYIQSNIRFLINNFELLNKKRGNLKTYEIIQ